MRSRYWAFAEACDEAESVKAVTDLLTSALRDIDIRGYAIATHAPLEDLGSLGVLVYNWPQPAIDFLFARETRAMTNPLFAMTEERITPSQWPARQGRRDGAPKPMRAWFDELRQLAGQPHGVSQGMKSVIVSASCSLTSVERLDPDRVRLAMRIANAAYQQVLALQKPKLNEADQLTPREHELLYRATIYGEKPADVAKELGVKISTVRTLRQKARSRLGSGSQEQAAWRMIETGQLFRSGHKGRLRRR